jgi:release factor glutamine methyltransferase
MTPRVTTEQLVAAAQAHIGDRVSRVVDVGTGSGAVAIAIANACPQAEVWATDISADAVRLARANVYRHGLGGRVFVHQGDLIAPVAGRFDVIVANLPYVPASAAADYPDLGAEPFDAVFAAGDGLDPTRRLVDAAATRLTDDGVLLLQLDGRLLAARRSELPALRAALAASRFVELPAAAVIEAIAGKAA